MKKTINFIFFYFFLNIIFSSIILKYGYSHVFDVYLVTIEPGNEIYNYWGHNGIYINDKKESRRILYDAGNFMINGGDIKAFIANEIVYWAEIRSYDLDREFYRSQDRSIYLQKLNFTDTEARELLDLLYEDVKPENRIYSYHHFTSNCSTKIRDFLNNVLNGQLEHQNYILSDFTYRDYANMGFEKNLFVAFIVNFLMNGNIDRKITRYEEMFYPLRLMEYIDQSYVIRGNNRYDLVLDKLQVYKKRYSDGINFVNIMFFVLLCFMVWGLYYPKVAFSRIRLCRFRISFTLFFLGLLFFIMSLLWFFMNFYENALDFVSGYNESHFAIFLTDIFLMIAGASYLFSASFSIRLMRFWSITKLWLISLYFIFYVFGFFSDDKIYIFLFVFFVAVLVLRLSSRLRKAFSIYSE